MKNVKLTNEFHNTSAMVRAAIVDYGDFLQIELSKNQMDRAAKKLCGISGCTCGGPAGIRGRQEIFGKKLIVKKIDRQRISEIEERE